MKYILAVFGFIMLLSIINSSDSNTTSNETPDNNAKEISEVETSPTPEAESEVANSSTPDSLTASSDTLVITQSAGDIYEVLRVIDGDTIEVMYNGSKRSVRYIGVDTPETVHPSKPVECMGKEASEYNKLLVTGKSVQLVRDVSDTDKYGRLLRYVYVNGIFVNEELVAKGYANVMTYPPDVKYIELFRQREQVAREQKLGLWGEVCEGTASSATTAPTQTTQSNPDNASCNIKGNISANGEKIYHVPGCQSYNKTVISEPAGEQWFCSEAEALSAGWRKALNCS